MREVINVSPARAPSRVLPAAAAAVLAAVAVLASPAGEAGASFSFSIRGGDFYHEHRGHHGGRYFIYFDHPGYRGHRSPYWRRQYHVVPRHRHYGSRHDWRYRPGPGPRCIYRYGYRYCR